MTSENRTQLYFPLRTSRLSTLRDLAMVAVCVAIVASFVVDLWRGPAPESFQAMARGGRVHLRA